MDRMRFGCFISPLHPPGEDPNLLLRRDIALAELADDLNFDEFWVGEHHSAGWGTVTSPELFIAAAAERTRRIVFATGVMTLPYHHPFMAAERAAQLDHLTRGRFILGVGAGSVPSDMHMLGIPVADTRRRTTESLEAVLPLLRGEVVSTTRDWFELHDARIQLGSFAAQGVEVAVASAQSPFGMRLAGTHGVSPLSYVSPPWGAPRAGHGLALDRLGEQWRHYEDAAASAGRKADRADWRLLLPVHVSSSREQAMEELYEGWLYQREHLWVRTMGMPLTTSGVGARKAFEYTVEAGGIIAGSPADCVAAIRGLQERSEGFGCLLLSLMDWAAPERVRRSLDLFARHVAPAFRHSAAGTVASNTWAAAHKDAFQQANSQARDAAVREAAAASPH